MGADLNIITCQDEWFNSVLRGSAFFCREGKCTSVWGEKQLGQVEKFEKRGGRRHRKSVLSMDERTLWDTCIF